MKLRLHSDTLRLRLSQSEVARLGAGERVEDIVSFPGDRTLEYAIEPGAVLSAMFDGRRVTVTVPAAQAKHWAENSEVGISGSDGPLKILIEKDFQCLHGPEATNVGLFPNPESTPD
jgi:hypothetical protein